MKKTFKIKALVLCMIAVMAFTLVPSVNAAKYTNAVTEANADIVVSMMADKTEVLPGDVVTLTFTLDKVPAGGVVACNTRLLYDSAKLTLNKYEGGSKNYVYPGEVAEALGYRHGKESVLDDTEIPNGKAISYGMSEDVDFAVTETGTIMTYQFTVNEGATGGAINMYLKAKNEGGLSLSGTKPGTGGQVNVDTDVTIFLKSNLDELTLKVPATGVKFEGITGVTLDTETNTQKSIASYVVIDPENTTDTISYRTEDTSVATVDNNGVVTAVGKGTTKVIVQVGNYSAELPVSVTVPLQSIVFDGLTSVELDVTKKPNQDISGNVKLLPVGAEVAGYEWASDDTDVVTVEDGFLTAVAKGTANVTVTAGGKSATIPVTVKASVGSVAIDLEKLVLDTATNNTADLSDKVVLNPVNADYEEMTWKSSDTDVVTVDNQGVVTVVGKGTAEITVTVDGKTATVPVSVTVPLTGIALETETIEVYKGDSKVVKITPTPEGAEWSSLDPSFRSGNEYATVKAVEGGVEVTGLAEGSSVIVVAANKALTGDLVKLLNVTIKENKITSIDIVAEDDEAVLRGETKDLDVEYETEISEDIHPTTDDTKVTWKSADEAIATVDEDGVVTGVKAGEVEITATMAGFEKTYKVTVEEIHVEGIEFSDETIAELEELEDVVVGDTVDIPFTITPEFVTDTEEEIIDFVFTQFDEELVDVIVDFDKETGKGVISVVAKKAGAVEVIIGEGIPEDDDMVWVLTFDIVEPVVEEPAPETGDIPVALFAGMMVISLAGILVSKKVLVK